MADLFSDEPETPVQAATRYARAGMKVFPVDMRPDENGQPRKAPPHGYLWKARATSVVNEVIEDFVNAEFDLGVDNVGIGWALGQDGYLALDLDGAEPEWWHGLGKTAVNQTKRGIHLVFRLPPGRRIGNGVSKFPTQGWGEVRGMGGYIVIWGSDRPGFDVAELGHIAPFPHPEWLTDAGMEADAVSPTELEEFKAAHTAGSLGRIKGFETALAARAPGASRHDHAVEVACWLAREAAAGLVPAREAFGVLEEWWAEAKTAKEDDTAGRQKTRKLTWRELRSIECWALGQLTPERVEEVRRKAEAEDAAWEAEQKAEREELNDVFRTASVTGMNLPEQFWTERPVLAHIRQAAQAQMASPEAVLANCIARTATLVPPSFRLPAVIGAEATLDFIGCVVADTSGGKGIGHGVARRLVPEPYHDSADDASYQVMMDLPVGSGEGIAQAFMVPEMKPGPDGELAATGKQVVGRRALHLNVDEGTAFVNQAERNGTTIIGTLASAWSGEALGNLNASKETRRVIEGGRVRVTGVINMQAENGHQLLTPQFLSVGLTGRILFATAHDPGAPVVGQQPAWPGELTWPELSSFDQAVAKFSYTPAMELEVRTERHGVLTRTRAIDKRRSQAVLLRCKVAAVLAYWDGRADVSDDDWRLAKAILASSDAVLAHVEDLKAAQDASRNEARAIVRGFGDAIAENARERKLVAELSKRIVDRVPAEGIGRMKLCKALTAKTTRHRFAPALELAVANLKVAIVDGRIEKVTP